MVRQRGEEFLPEELAYKPAVVAEDPQSGEAVEIEAEDLLYGLNKLLKALESINGKTDLDKKGELRSAFYLDLKRRPGERIGEFCTRFRTLVADLKSESINLPSSELGWFLRDKLGLDSIRKQLLETALQGRDGYEDVEGEVLRLFKDLHVADPLSRRFGPGGGGSNDGKPALLNRFLGQSSAPSTRSMATSSGASSLSSLPRSFRTSTTSSTTSRQSFRSRPPGGNGRQAMVAEHDEPEVEEAAGEEELVPAEEMPGQQLEEVLQAEAQLLAEDLQVLEDEGCEPELLEELEAGVESAAEALVSMREARARINDVKKDRGYGKSGGGKGGAVDNKPHGNQTNSQKKNTRCFDCGQLGHWAGDKMCTKPGAGLGRKDKKGKQVLISENVTEHAIGNGSGVPSPTSPTGSPPHDVMVVSAYGGQEMKTLSEALASTRGGDPPVASPIASELAHDKRLVGALDSACNRTVTGFTWLHGFLEELKTAPASVQSLVKRESESELFRFGNGGVQHSYERWRLPMVVGDQLILLWTSVVGVPSLGLLLGRDFLDGIGAVLSFSQRLLRCDHLNNLVVPLRQMAAGHFLLQLIPQHWRRPDEGRWRRLGQDGIIEMQITAEEWVKRKFGATKGAMSKSHEHLVTENSVLAADLANSGLDRHGLRDSVTGVARDAMTVTAVRIPTSSTSPTTWTSSSDARARMRTAKSTGDAMEKVRGKDGRSFRLAHPGCLALVAAAAYFAMGPTAVPIGGNNHPMEGAGGGYGSKPHYGPSTPSKSTSSWGLHHEESAGRSVSPKPSWPRIQFPGGPRDGDGNEGCSQCKGHESQDSSTGHVGSKARSQQGEGCRQTKAGRSRVDWSTRRSSYPASRSLKACCTFECGAGRKGNCRTDQEAGQTYGDVVDEGTRPKQPRSDSGHGGCQATSFTTTDLKCCNDLDNTEPVSPHGRVCGVCFGPEGGSRNDHGTRRKVSRFCAPSPKPHDVYAVDGFHTGFSGIDGLPTSNRHGANWRDDESRRGDVFSRGDCPDECRPCRVHEDSERRASSNLGRNPEGRGGGLQESRPVNEWNPFSVNQELKKGVAQLVSQAWGKHERERGLISKSPKEIYEVLKKDWFQTMENGINEAFISSISLETQPLVTEVFTTTERVQREAERRGHATGTAMSLETGWNFLLPEHRERAKEVVRKEKPYFLMIAFPCNPWSALLRLNSAVDLDRIRGEGLELVKFSLELAQLQLEGGRHYALENPLTSEAWKIEEMKKFLNETTYFEAIFDQCQFNLRGRSGHLHKKATKIVSSSGALRDELHGRRCLRDHQHEPVIGGSSVTRPAGHYPVKLAGERNGETV